MGAIISYCNKIANFDNINVFIGESMKKLILLIMTLSFNAAHAVGAQDAIEGIPAKENSEQILTSVSYVDATIQNYVSQEITERRQNEGDLQFTGAAAAAEDITSAINTLDTVVTAGAPVDAVQDGNMKPVTSNAVYDWVPQYVTGDGLTLTGNEFSVKLSSTNSNLGFDAGGGLKADLSGVTNTASNGVKIDGTVIKIAMPGLSCEDFLTGKGLPTDKYGCVTTNNSDGTFTYFPIVHSL